MFINKKNALRTHRSNTSIRKDISAKRVITTLTRYKVTKIGPITQPDTNGLDLARQQSG
jgi:hypothetical protein